MWDQTAAQAPGQQTVGINATFQECIDNENAKITGIGNNLLNFANLAAQSQDLERIYADLYTAYSAGVEALDTYRHKLTEASFLEQGYTQRMTEQQREAIDQVPASKRPALFHLMGGLVACMDRPTDKFRKILKKHQKAIFDNLINLAQSDEITAEAYHANVVYIVNLLCLFDIVPQDNNMALIGGIGAGIFGFLAGTESDFKPLETISSLFDVDDDDDDDDEENR